MKTNHSDYQELKPIIDEVIQRFGGLEKLQNLFPEVVKEALDYVIDPVTTGRTKVSDLDSIEKTFIGLKVEHFLRDALDVPSGLRDLRIADRDVDIKNTVRNTWMIPPESFRNEDPCLLIMTATDKGECSFGIMLAKPAYLNAPNRDGKRSVSAFGKQNIVWLLQRQALPTGRFNDLDMERFRSLRKVKGGSRRVATFCRENPDRIIHRQVFEALLFDQKDPMKRLRGNGGARDILQAYGFRLLSGTYDRQELIALGYYSVTSDDWVCIRESNSCSADL